MREGTPARARKRRSLVPHFDTEANANGID